MGAGSSTNESYDYDAYGEAFHYELDKPDSSVTRPRTDLLYAGEQWDADLGMQYLRARYYLPGQGIFNRLDPFFGNLDDPQSLHKYAYVHGDPVNGIDPSGLLNLSEISLVGTLLSAGRFLVTPSLVGVGLGFLKSVTLDLRIHNILLGLDLPLWDLANHIAVFDLLAARKVSRVREQVRQARVSTAVWGVFGPLIGVLPAANIVAGGYRIVNAYGTIMQLHEVLVDLERVFQSDHIPGFRVAFLPIFKPHAHIFTGVFFGTLDPVGLLKNYNGMLEHAYAFAGVNGSSNTPMESLNSFYRSKDAFFDELDKWVTIPVFRNGIIIGEAGILLGP